MTDLLIGLRGSGNFLKAWIVLKMCVKILTNSFL